MHRELFPRWSAPPARLGLTTDQVDVWRIGLGHGHGQDVPAQDQRGYAHRALQRILAVYLACRPADLRLSRHAGGKPYLADPRHSIEFNLSHSRDTALVAISKSFQVGIDIESWRTIEDPLRLARRVMSSAELAELEALAVQDRCAHFLRLWTRMEARQKALGLGVFAPPADPTQLASFDFRPDRHGYASLSLAPPAGDPQLRFLEYVPL